MSRGERALTVYDAAWERIIEARPDLADINYDAVWGRDDKHVWGRVDSAKLKTVSLMKKLGWSPTSASMSGSRRVSGRPMSEGDWRRVMDSISADGLLEFSNWAIKSDPALATMNLSEPLSDDEAALLASMPAIQQQAPAQWGTW